MRLIEIESRMAVARAWEEGGQESVNECRLSPAEGDKIARQCECP